MENAKYFLIGLVIGLVITLCVYIVMVYKRKKVNTTKDEEINKYKSMLTDRMELENEGITKLKKENEELKEKNKNLEVSLLTLSQKSGKKEIQRLEIYQAAVDKLSLQSPGFAPAWQAAIRESEAEFNKVYKGGIPFFRKFISSKNNVESDQDS